MILGCDFIIALKGFFLAGKLGVMRVVTSQLGFRSAFSIRTPFFQKEHLQDTGVGAYAGHVARPKYYENLSWGPHYTETICHPLGIHLKPFTDVSGHKTAQKLSKIKKNG